MTSMDNSPLLDSVNYIRSTVLPAFPKLIDGMDIPVGSIADIAFQTSVRSTPVRIYRPGTAGPHAAVFYLHGGAFCLSSNADDEPMARQLVRDADCAVFSIDYGVAPEYPFPGALEEAYEVMLQVLGDAGAYGIDPERIAVAGNSAGATLAAALCILASHRRQFHIRALSVIYPALDSSIPHADKLSGKAAGTRLRTEMIDLLVMKAYLGGDRTLASDPLVSPLLADYFSVFPPTFLVTAERDPFTPENLRFAERLRLAGTEVLHKHCVGMDHGLMDMGGAEALQRECKTLVSSQLKIWLNR